METEDIVNALAALAQETRLEAFARLVRSGGAGMPAGALAADLGVPAATLSFHLKELRHAGLVCCRREGRSKVYAPAFEAMRELLGYLTERCCEDSPCCGSTAADGETARRSQ